MREEVSAGGVVLLGQNILENSRTAPGERCLRGLDRAKRLFSQKRKCKRIRQVLISTTQPGGAFIDPGGFVKITNYQFIKVSHCGHENTNPVTQYCPLLNTIFTG